MRPELDGLSEDVLCCSEEEIAGCLSAVVELVWLSTIEEEVNMLSADKNISLHAPFPQPSCQGINEGGLNTSHVINI